MADIKNVRDNDNDAMIQRLLVALERLDFLLELVAFRLDFFWDWADILWSCGPVVFLLPDDACDTVALFLCDSDASCCAVVFLGLRCHIGTMESGLSISVCSKSSSGRSSGSGR